MLRILFLLVYGVEAHASLGFKKDVVASVQWTPYCIILIVLLIVLWALAKFIKPKAASTQKAKIIDIVSMHNKTKAYVLDYEGQQFLIAENQNAIAIHVLKQGIL